MWRINRFFRAGNLHSGQQRGVRGLTNHRLCCCLNSLLQAFSATWELAELLDRWESDAVGYDMQNVPLQLKGALAAMQSDHHQSDPHRALLHCLHKNDVPLSIQHDAEEVFLCIHNLIQKQMDNKAVALDIQNLYRIVTETQVQCLVCSTIQSGSSYLLSLPLPLRAEENSLESCVKSFFEFQELHGRDKCFCAQCGTKTASKQGVKLLSLPSILCVQLKRVWNYGGIPQKLHCTVTFPESLDFAENFPETFSTHFTEENCKYVLYAVVVHAGSTMCGHYTAYVRQQGNPAWYYANDSHVEPASWEDVQRTYGGSFRATAYMLMYRRSSVQVGEAAERSG
ncbi:ubl carboxyl-terminal hydrolase 18 [Genypterus blacodes]|uniref:ubl carboxyl-terminal hydrolase 18 n=1 Tax=Genypterus blacodes TaxID=154954 RepID=UPI003F7774C1